MEPTTITAIFNGIMANAPTALLAAAANPIVADAWKGLKALLRRKLGDNSRLLESIQDLEKNPQDEGCRLSVQGDAMKAKLDNYPELLAAVKELQEALRKADAEFDKAAIVVKGDFNTVATHGGIAVGGSIHGGIVQGGIHGGRNVRVNLGSSQPDEEEEKD